MKTNNNNNNNNNDESSDDEHDDDQNKYTYQIGKQILDNAFCSHFDNNNVRNEGFAYDVIVVEAEDGRLHHNSDLLVRFKGERDYDFNSVVMKVEHDKQSTQETGHDSGAADAAPAAAWFHINKKDGNNDTTGNPSKEEKSSIAALKSILQPGRNAISYFLFDGNDDKQKALPFGIARAFMFLWWHTDSVVVSDIDGTITKSNARGVLGTIVTSQYDKAAHDGICHLLTAFSQKSQVVYLTSRPIILANHTRKFLANLKQKNDDENENPLDINIIERAALKKANEFVRIPSDARAAVKELTRRPLIDTLTKDRERDIESFCNLVTSDHVQTNIGNYLEALSMASKSKSKK